MEQLNKIIFKYYNNYLSTLSEIKPVMVNTESGGNPLFKECSQGIPQESTCLQLKSVL